MADRPLKQLSWKTPLEIAHKPTLNHIAKTGITGILDPIAPGIPPGSDTATLALLGYDPTKTYTGRGAFEALGSNVQVQPGDIAFRCNFATVDKNQTVLDRRAGRIANQDATKLTKSLQNIKLPKTNIKYLFKNTVQHRAVLVIRGPSLSPAVSDSDPETNGRKIQQIKPLDDSQQAKKTAEYLNTLTNKFQQTLQQSPINKTRIQQGLQPANIILIRGAGTIPKIKTLKETYNITSACIAAVSLIKGVCTVAGMKIINVKGATGTPQTDYSAKAKAAVQALTSNDFVLLHVKATDVASHDGKPQQKIETIEKIDKMLSYVHSNVDQDSTYLTVTADHTTSTVTGRHEGDPVPAAITGPYIRTDNVKQFSERACAEGGLNRIRGVDLMPTLMNLIEKTTKFGA
jgi:2,3-bisphosphoglycerate-independent phosphoglycerate mutase